MIGILVLEVGLCKERGVVFLFLGSRQRGPLVINLDLQVKMCQLSPTPGATMSLPS